jgi:hypothetical protein
LATSGAKDATSGSSHIIGKRKSFSSPVETSYLLTIATSDGAGEGAPGSEKESVDVAPLSLSEGLRLAVLSMGYSCSDINHFLLRYGHLRSSEELNGSTHIGDEIDFQYSRKLSDSSLVQLDVAYLFAGDFFTNPENGYLAAAKYQFEF